MTIRTLLVPIDFSTCSESVTRRAASLASQLGAKLVLAHVARIPTGLSHDTPIRPGGLERSAGEYVRSDSNDRLAPFVATALAAGARVVEQRVELGDIVSTILELIDDERADMVVMGTHGRTGLARLVLGSVAEGVAHRAHVPILLIRREPRTECARESCAWCTEDGQSPAEVQLSVETDG